MTGLSCILISLCGTQTWGFIITTLTFDSRANRVGIVDFFQFLWTRLARNELPFQTLNLSLRSIYSINSFFVQPAFDFVYSHVYKAWYFWRRQWVRKIVTEIAFSIELSFSRARHSVCITAIFVQLDITSQHRTFEGDCRHWELFATVTTFWTTNYRNRLNKNLNTAVKVIYNNASLSHLPVFVQNYELPSLVTVDGPTVSSLAAWRVFWSSKMNLPLLVLTVLVQLTVFDDISIDDVWQ